MRVLVIEDDEPFRELLRRALETHGYAADLAADAEEALSLLPLAPYDLVLLDVMLPRTTGVEFCARLRKAGCDVPILMLTARDAVEDKVLGLDAGADDYLTKPVAFPELFARLRVLLRRHDGQRDPLLRLGELLLNPAHRRVEVAGKVVELTGKEFAILELLLRHPGQVFARDDIAEHVWGFDYEGESNLIEVYIGRLRRKLGNAAGYLVTLRGQGYSMRS